MNPQMYKAASTGDLSFFDSLTASDSTLLQVTTEKNTVLHIAVQFKNYEVAEKIVCLSRCLAKHTNSKDNTPLHVAAKVGNPQMVRFLIDHAEDWDVETSAPQFLSMVNLEGDTALHIAVQFGNFEVVKELIKVDPKLAMCVNKVGESVLFLAVDRDLYDIASHILSATQECSYAGRHGMNVLHALVIQTSSYINQGMTKMTLADQRIQNDQTKSLSERFEINCELPPRHSFGTIQEDFVRKVMEKCPFTIKQGDDSGWTPLHFAAHIGNNNYVKLLLENDNSPANIKNNKGLSALHIAAKKGNIDVMTELIRTSPDICELLDDKGQTALHVAVESGKSEAVRFFLRRPEFKGLINEQDKEGKTPINLAAIKQPNMFVSLLKEGEGLDFNARNKEGFTTLDHILLQEKLNVYQKDWNNHIAYQLRLKGARPSLMGALSKLGIRKAGDGEEKAGPNSVRKENQTNLLVATLIATVTFTAAFTVPGGYQNQGVDEGLAVLSKRASFCAFLIANALAFNFSITSLLVYFIASIRGFRIAFWVGYSHDCTFYATLALVVAFISGTYTVVPHSLGITVVFILSLPFTFGFDRLMSRVRALCRCIMRQVRCAGI